MSTSSDKPIMPGFSVDRTQDVWKRLPETAQCSLPCFVVEIDAERAESKSAAIRGPHVPIEGVHERIEEKVGCIAFSGIEPIGNRSDATCRGESGAKLGARDVAQNNNRRISFFQAEDAEEVAVNETRRHALESNTVVYGANSCMAFRGGCTGVRLHPFALKLLRNFQACGEILESQLVPCACDLRRPQRTQMFELEGSECAARGGRNNCYQADGAVGCQMCSEEKQRGLP